MAEWINDEWKRHIDMAKEFLGLKNREAHAELPGVMTDQAEERARQELRKTMATMRKKQGPGMYQGEVE